MKVAICDGDRENCEKLCRMIQGREPGCEVKCFCNEDQWKEAGRYFQAMMKEIKGFPVAGPDIAGGIQGQLHFQTKSRNYDLGAEEILYIESMRRKVEIHTAEEVFSVYATMKGMQELLGEVFFRCHRGYLVNLSKVKEYDMGSVHLVNGETIYLAREKYPEFARAYARYLDGGQ